MRHRPKTSQTASCWFSIVCMTLYGDTIVTIKGRVKRHMRPGPTSEPASAASAAASDLPGQSTSAFRAALAQPAASYEPGGGGARGKKQAARRCGPVNPTTRLEISAPFLGSLNENCQSFVGERRVKLQTPHTPSARRRCAGSVSGVTCRGASARVTDACV
jgi:hypothetical protein